MKPGRAHNPTAPMKAQVHHLSKAAKAAKVGGYVLTAVNVGISCHQIANTKSRVGKNRVLFETVGGMAAGAGAVALIGLAVTPVGWVAILAVAAAGAVAGYAGGKAAVAMYDGHGKKYDVVQTLGIDTVCNPDSGIGSL